MKVGKSILLKFNIFIELLTFLWKRKLWWLIPLIIILVMFGLLLIFTQSSPVSSFIYSLF